jgi:hypothetical protein
MLTFRPISYDDADLRAFKYTGTADVREGQICYIPSSASNTLNIIAATPWSGVATALPTLHMGGAHPTVSIQYMNGKLFAIFREDPDPESVSPTIEQGDYCIGFPFKSGAEFEIHYSVTEYGVATFSDFTKGGRVTLGSTGLFTCVSAVSGMNNTGLVIGICLGTFNGKYARIRCI